MFEFDELMIRIPIETSILFLGQMYEQNLLLKNLNEKYREIVIKNSNNISYSELITSLIEYCEQNPEEKNAILNSIINAGSAIHDNRFDRIAPLGWSGIITSLMHAMPGFQSLSAIVRHTEIKTDYFSKRKKKLSYLFGQAGNEQGNIPLTYEEQMRAETSKDQIWGQIVTKVNLRGVLVVDGWDPELDWVTEKDFNAFISCPKQSIYFFNLSDKAKRKPQIQKLISKGIAVLLEGSFYDWVHEREIQIDDSIFDVDDEEDSVEITLDSLLDKTGKSVRRIGTDSLNQLHRSIILLDDSILDYPNYLDCKEYFMRFLSTENSEPLWGGYASGFYFKRDIDDKLFDEVERQLRNNDPAKSKVIVIEGRNASGKSACLGNLAYRLRQQKRYPVIYITAEMKDNRYFEQLFRLIRNQINEKLGARKTVVIWDGNFYDNDYLYDDLRKHLEECNVVVAGSKYVIGDKSQKGNRNAITLALGDDLSEETEMPALRDALSKVAPEYAKHFDEIHHTISHISDNLKQERKRAAIKTYSDQGNWFLLILYRLFEDLHKSQRHSVENEVQLAENDFVEWLKKYADEKFQNNCFAILYENLGFEKPDNSEEYRRFVSDIYNMIAVAGKYGLELPAMVIYRVYEEECGYDWGELAACIDRSSVIEMVSYEDATLTVRFRRSLMASLFLEEQVQEDVAFADKELLNLEVTSLLKIIHNTNFNDIRDVDDSFSESMQVVNLIRKFGPNGPDPLRYREYFLSIAREINNSNNDMNDEAILVSSHLIREAYTDNSNYLEQNNLLLAARSRLNKAINRHGRYDNSKQLSRLKVELCSNLLWSIQSKESITKEELEIFEQINKYVDDAMAIELNRFSAGAFFDASLRVYPLMKEGTYRDKTLSRMLQIVDEVNDEPYSDFGDSIYAKTLKILELAKLFQEIDETNIRLLKEESDVGIYRMAMIALNGYGFNKVPDKNEMNDVINAIKILENYLNIVKKNPRTLYLYIRLLWVHMTGKPPFTEKQRISMLDDDWKKIVMLCKLYISNENAQKKAFPYFVYMIDAFKEGNTREYEKVIHMTSDFKNKMPAYITFAVLCDEHGNLVRENIKVIHSTSRRTVYSAMFDKPLYKGLEAYFKASNFKDILEISDGISIKDAVIGFNMYGVVVYGESDLKSQMGGDRN